MTQVMSDMNNFIYLLDDKIYVNLTNACSNACQFCIRTQKDDVMGANLWLKSDADFETVISQLENKKLLLKNGVTFCGYGEPLLEFELLVEIAKYIKKNHPNTRIKVNTNGHANAIFKKDITLYLKDYIDEVSVSLNAQNEKLYMELCNPKIENAFNEVINFSKSCVANGIETTMTIVTNYKGYDIDAEACKKIADDIGANFRERPWLENGY